MKLVTYHSNDPAELIAMDELLLNKAEAGEIDETLRFWSPEEYFIVVGRAGRTAEDCFLDRCRRGKIRIIRRISGGGTVLQGPGCFNYSAIISYETDGAYRGVRSSYGKILGKIRDALKTKRFNAEVFPLSDIALGTRKISGNAQARKRKFFLHHGTFLHDFDVGKVSLYLRHPCKEPEYRQNRAHGDFLANIPIPGEELEETLKEVFLVSQPCIWEPGQKDQDDLKDLVCRKFSQDEWNFAF